MGSSVVGDLVYRSSRVQVLEVSVGDGSRVRRASSHDPRHLKKSGIDAIGEERRAVTGGRV